MKLNLLDELKQLDDVQNSEQEIINDWLNTIGINMAKKPPRDYEGDFDYRLGDNLQEKILKYIKNNVFFDMKNNKYLMFEEKTGILNEINTQSRLEEILNDKIKAIFNEPIIETYISGKSVKKWYRINWQKVITYLPSFNTVSGIRYTFDPFKPTSCIFNSFNELLININKIPMDRPTETIDNIPEGLVNSIIQEYLYHFKELEEVLNFIVASRFDKSRKTSFLYINVPTNFGKSFFISMLNKLNICYTLNERSISRDIMRFTANDIKNKMVLAFDEFKKFPAIFKEITHELTVNALYSNSEKVEVFAKIMLSAEKSESFIAPDKQIVNRVNILKKVVFDKYPKELLESEYLEGKDTSGIVPGDITTYPFFKHYKHHYDKVISNLIYVLIRKKINKYLELNEDDAIQVAAKFMEKFHEKYILKTMSIEDRIFEYMYEKLADYTVGQKEPKGRMAEIMSYVYPTGDDNEFIVTSVKEFFKLLIETNPHKQEKASHMYKTQDAVEILGLYDGGTHYLGNGVSKYGYKFNWEEWTERYKKIKQGAENE